MQDIREKLGQSRRIWRTLGVPSLTEREALDLALAHIDWLWDLVEPATGLHREGSAHLIDRLKEASSPR